MTWRSLRAWSAHTTLWICLLMSALGHSMLVYWLDKLVERPVLRGLDHAAIEIALIDSSHTDAEAGNTRISEPLSGDVAAHQPPSTETPATSTPIPSPRAVPDQTTAVLPLVVNKAAAVQAKMVNPLTHLEQSESIESDSTASELAPAEPAAMSEIVADLPPPVVEDRPSEAELSAQPSSPPLVFAEPPGHEEQASATPALQTASLVAPPARPRYIRGSQLTPEPEYPRVARNRGWQGEVLIELTVSASGEVLEASLARSSGFGILDKAALNTLKDWQLSAGPAGEKLLVPVIFTIQ